MNDSGMRISSQKTAPTQEQPESRNPHKACEDEQERFSNALHNKNGHRQEADAESSKKDKKPQQKEEQKSEQSLYAELLHHAPASKKALEAAPEKNKAATHDLPGEGRPEAEKQVHTSASTGKTPEHSKAQDQHDKSGRHDDASQAQGISGDAILKGMQPQPSQPEADAGKAEQQSAAASSIADRVDQVCQRMLVSKGDTSGGREVRLQLKNDVLPDTEVRISMHNGALQVSLVSDNPASQAVLSQYSSELADKLQQRQPEGTRVEVHVRDQKEQDQSESQDQGRSRQQRDMYKEMQNDE